MYEKRLLEVKTDQKRTILAKKAVFRTSGGKPNQSISSAFVAALRTGGLGVCPLSQLTQGNRGHHYFDKFHKIDCSL